MKIKQETYPLYNREQNLNCKLSNEDIEKIGILLKLGHKKTWIAKEMCINRSTIYYYFDGGVTKIKNQKWNKAHYSPDNHYQNYGKKFFQRKRQLQGKEYRQFDAFARSLYRKGLSLANKD